MRVYRGHGHLVCRIYVRFRVYIGFRYGMDSYCLGFGKYRVYVGHVHVFV